MSIFVSLCWRWHCVRSWHFLKLFTEQLPHFPPSGLFMLIVLVALLPLCPLSKFELIWHKIWCERGEGESKGGREFYVPQNANCALCERGWRHFGEGRFCHCLRYNNFLGPGKVSCLVHAASGGYLQHFCGTWLHAGRLWQLWQPFGGQNQTSLEQENVNCSYWLCVLCIELGSTTVGESRRGKQLAVSLDDCKQLCDGLKVGLGGEVIGR